MRNFFKLGLLLITILILFVQQLPCIACKTQLSKCRIQDPIPIVHNYLQPGDLTIGAITSFVFINRDIKGFEEDPHHLLAFDSL